MKHSKNKNQTIIKTIGDDGNVLIKDCPVLLPKENIDMFMEISADADTNAKRWEEYGNSYKKKLIENFARAANSNLLTESFDFNSVNDSQDIMGEDLNNVLKSKVLDTIYNYIFQSGFHIFKEDIIRYDVIKDRKLTPYIFVAYFSYNLITYNHFCREGDIITVYDVRDYGSKNIPNWDFVRLLDDHIYLKEFLNDNDKYNVSFIDNGYRRFRYTGDYNIKTNCLYLQQTNAIISRNSKYTGSPADYDNDDLQHTTYFIMPYNDVFTK